MKNMTQTNSEKWSNVYFRASHAHGISHQDYISLVDEYGLQF